MNELQIFNFNNHAVRTVMIDEEPYFVGKDVAEILGYANPSKALIDHVDDEDKLNNESLSSLGQRGGWVINESGVYTLVFGSKLPQAKQFKRWVTSEVLPTLRKNGSYQLPKTTDEKIRLLLQSSVDTSERVGKVEERVLNLEENRFLNPNEYGYLNNQIAYRIKEIKGVYDWKLNKAQNRCLFRAIGKEIKEITGVRCRSQLRSKDFEKVLEFVSCWEPSKATLTIMNEKGD